MTDAYRYKTKESDADTGLIYFGARYYNPLIGRFITPDSLGMVDGANLYIYCGNNPIGIIDPWGECWENVNWKDFSSLLFLLGVNIHYDKGQGGELLIHIIKDKWNFRFNKMGDLVKHTGKIIDKVKGPAAKALKYLKNINPEYFIKTPIIFVIPPKGTDPIVDQLFYGDYGGMI